MKRKVHFYVPQLGDRSDEFTEAILFHPDEYHLALTREFGLRDSAYCWIVQTWLRLRNTLDAPCTLTGRIPAEGVIVALRTAIATDWIPNRRQILVCCGADKDPHQFADFNVVGNAGDILLARPKTRERLSVHFMPHWPQIGLRRRRSERGGQVVNIAYIGEKRNLAAGFCTDDWQRRMDEIGCRFLLQPRELWHDFSEVDVVLAIREERCGLSYHKPATKLYNAWHAEVPAVLGRESAFLAERASPLDYLEADDLDSAAAAVGRLVREPQLYNEMVENGRRRAKARSIESTSRCWREFIHGMVFPALEATADSNAQRKKFLNQRGAVAGDPEIWDDIVRRCVGAENFV